MHPRDDADDAVIAVRVEHRTADRLRVRQHRLPVEADGHAGAELGGDRLRLLGDLRERLRAVEVLAAGEEQDPVGVETGVELCHWCQSCVFSKRVSDDCPYTFW
ncbi:hypothetical protein GCM10009869_20310 [Amnibacterium kyonggiense]